MTTALMRDIVTLAQGPLSVEEIVKLVCPLGVVVGGTYEHFKGKRYKVLGFLRDAFDWDGEIRVKYVQVDDVEHEAVRRISDFLDNVERPEYTGPRFRLVKT